MADNPLLQALLGVNVTPQETLFGQGAQTIGTMMPKVYSPYVSPGRNLASIAGAGLLAGLMGYAARREAEAENRALAPQLSAILSAQTPEELSTLSSAEGFPSRLMPVAAQLTQQRIQQQSDLRAEIAKAQRLAEIDVAKTQATARPGQLLGFDPTTGRPLITQMETPAISETRTVEPVRPLFPGANDLETERVNVLNQELERGIPPGAASTTAQKAVEGKRAIAGTLTQNLVDLRKNIDAADQQIAIAKSGVSKAGETGGLAAQRVIRTAAAQVLGSLSNIDPFGIDYLKQQRTAMAGEAELGQIKPDIISSAKFPGAISNREVEILVGSGPSPEKTPEQNRQIIRNLELIQKRNRALADFYSRGIEQGIDPAQLERKWREYTAAVPLWDEAKQQINYNPKSPEEYFWGTQDVSAVKQAGQEMIRQLQAKYGATWRTQINDEEKVALKSLVDSMQGR